ncbi:hypothetical protein MFLO_04650 [Listeria floridensis FSL S10-1187]|uniref:Uncharacterized protein n=1 Tax=Listeria floridensis FSL S10-1187 TaxID=1265817 RepID=A0ABP3AZX5_9LIST|nr:hypothetical protein [Listeria floridensis]EUJ33195.1 hypothetical protein MFLO_04650 [Listeria floridensis FSL S10-1187]
MDKSTRSFLFFSCALTIAFLIALNFLVFPGQNWSLYSSLLLLLPLVYFLIDGSRHYKTYSVIGSLVVFAVLSAANLIESPDYLWVLFAIPALAAWPLVIIMGKKAAKFSYAFSGAVLLILCYVVLNLIFEPRFPFSIFTTFTIMWWPLSVALAKFSRAFSLVGTAWMTLFFIIVNIITTPVIWWIYPVFALLFWPLSMFLARYPLSYAILSTLILSSFFIIVNLITSRDTIWAVYPIFGLLWWPLSIYFFVYRRKHVKRKYI